MAEKVRGVQIDLDKTRHLKFNHNAIAVLENVVGKTVSEIFSSLGTAMGFDMLRTLLYAALIHEDFSLRKKPTHEGLWLVGEWIEESIGDTPLERLSYVQGKLTEALTAAFGEPQKNVETPAPTAGASLGSGTGTTPSGQPSASVA